MHKSRKTGSLPPGARGRRFKLFPDGDVFIYAKREADGSLEPLSRVDTAGDTQLLQFHNVEDARAYVKACDLREYSGRTVIIAELRRLFRVEAEEKVSVRMNEKKRLLAELKGERKPVLNVEIKIDEEDKESA